MYKFSVHKIVVYYLVSVNFIYLLLYALAPEYLVEGYPFINLFNLLTANLYGIVVAFLSQNYNPRKGYLLFLYFVFLTLAIKLIFIFVNDSYFAFAEGDSLDYHLLATNMVNYSFGESLNLLAITYELDDWGFPFVLYILYSILESPFTLTAFNVLCVFLIFKMVRFMCLRFMSERASVVATLLIVCSQYMFFYSARGLKEILMVTIVIASFYYYFKYLHSKKGIYIFLSIITTVILIFFRIPLVLFILVGVVFNHLIRSKTKLKNVLLVFFVGFTAIALWSVSDLMFRYAAMLNTVGELQSIRFSYSSGFTYLVAMLSGLLGPFPTFVPVLDHVNNSFYAGSLFFKVLLSPFFLVGIYKILKNKDKYLVPLLVFCICEIFSLIYILEPFEFRKSMPHIPFVIMVAVYVIDTWRVNRTTKALMKYGSTAGLIVLVLLWNLLRLK